MSRHSRGYATDRYEERESDVYRRPRREREYDDLEVDITRSRNPESRRQETIVKERDTVVGERRGHRQPDFLREDYGKSTTAGALVVREEDEREEEVYTRRSGGRRGGERVEKDKFVFEERERSDRGPPYPRDRGSELAYRGRDDTEEKVIFRERTRSRPPPREEVDTEEKVIIKERTRSRPPPQERVEKEEIDISIRRDESRGPPPPRSPAPVEEIRFRRGGGERPRPPRLTVDETEIDITREESRGPPPRPRSAMEREKIDIDIRESRSPARGPSRNEVDEEIIFRESQRSGGRGREVVKEEIDIREKSAPPPRHRSRSRPTLVARKEEEWVVRRPRTPPPQDYEKEQIIIRRKERTPSPETPPREPTPEPSPPPPPPLDPIYRPPIIQEVITHHRHIDHGFERARSPTPPPPSPPSPPPVKESKEDNLEIEIKRKGTRNGKAYEEDIIIEQEKKESQEPSREIERYEDRKRDVSVGVVSRRRSHSPRGRYDDEIAAEADYYTRKIKSRAYPGEAYNGATKDWGLVDIPPGTERVRMDGVGGGAQEVFWERYSGQRRGRFISGEQAYEQEYGNGYPRSAAPLPPPPPSSHRGGQEEREEIKITHTTSREEKSRRRDRMWTEVTKDLVVKEAIEEMGYEYEETNENFYVLEYLRYEDVVRLVEVTEDIKRQRRERIREIQWEREERERVPKMIPPPPVPAPPRSRYDERIYERDYIYDREGRRRR